MKVEIFKENHIKEVIKIEKVLYSLPWTEFDFKMVLNDLSLNFVLIENDIIAGYLCSLIESNNTVHLLNFAIKKEFQGKGWGKKFLIFFLYFILKPNNLYKVILEVRESNYKAISLYKKIGFTQINKIKNYYHNPIEDALIMFIDLEKNNFI